MKFKLSLFSFLLLVSIFTVHAQDVTVGFDKSVNFSQFKTYSWTSGVPARNPFIDQRIRQGVEQQLAARGLRHVEKGGDINVMFIVAMETDLQSVSSRWVTTGNWMTPITSGITVRNQSWNVDTGTLVVCLSDASDKNLLWRGMAKTRLEEKSKKQNAFEAMTEDARKADKKIGRALDKMFKQYPAGTSEGREQ